MSERTMETTATAPRRTLRTRTAGGGSQTTRPALAGRLMLCLLLAVAAAPALSAWQPPAEPAPAAEAVAAQPPAGDVAEHQAAGHEADGEHEAGLLPLVARLFNFAILAGVLVYFLRQPLATYLASRSAEIRQDLVNAAATRDTATKQLAEIQQTLADLPQELEALKARGAEDLRLERERLTEAAAAERERLLEHAHREIDTKLRVARRELVEHTADLAVEVARARITGTITPDDQLRLVDRYAGQLQGTR